MSDQAADSRFLALSQILTGFGQQTIGNALKGFDYQQVLATYTGAESVEALLNAYQKRKDTGASDQEIGYAILNLSDSNIALLARAMMKLWYLGMWIQPFDYGPYKTGGVPIIVDPMAYQQSLAGPVAQAKAIGVPAGQGGWDKAPDDLKSFTK